MTLIEVMLAAAILATIVVITWGSLSSSFRLRTASLDKFERYRTVQQTLDRMSREISMAFVTNVGLNASSLSGEATYRTIFDGQENELNFTSLAHVRTRVGDVASEQCEISYRLERRRGEDGQQTTVLIRREQAPIDANPDSGGIKYVMLPDVVSVRFEYWDSTREIAGDGWIRSWDAIRDHNGMLPERVRITLEVKHPTLDRQTLTFMTQTEIFLREPLVIVPENIAAEQRAVQQAIEEELRRQGFEDNSLLRGRDLDDFFSDDMR